MRTKWIGLLGVLFGLLVPQELFAQVVMVPRERTYLIQRPRIPKTLIEMTAETKSFLEMTSIGVSLPQPQFPTEELVPMPPPLTQSEADVRCSASAEEAELEIAAFLHGLRELPKGEDLLFRWDHPEGWHRCYDAVRRSFERSFERLVRILPAPSPSAQ